MKQVRAAWVLGMLAGGCDAPRYSDGPRDAETAPCRGAACANDAGWIADLRAADSGRETTDAGPQGGVDPADAAATNDAGSWDNGAGDAAASTLSADEAALVGTYAIRVRFHGQDRTLGTLAPFANELIMLARIAADGPGAGLQMTAQLCRDRGAVNGPFSQLFAEMRRPELQPLRQWSVSVHGGEFHTEGPATRVGYEEAAPAGCSPGAKLPRRAAQVWLGETNASCTCPSSELPPTLPSDCRVTDPDLDGHPGVTIALAGAVESEDYVRLKDSSQFVDGIVASGKRHRSSFDKLEEMYQLACAQGGCTRANLQACSAKSNTALFSPLTELAADGKPWSCDLLLAEIAAGRPFVDEPLDFLSGC